MVWIGINRHLLVEQLFSEFISAAFPGNKASPFISAPGVEVANHHTQQITDGRRFEHDGVPARLDRDRISGGETLLDRNFTEVG